MDQLRRAIGLLLCVAFASTAQADTASSYLMQVREAFAALEGQWQGSLTYIDYGNGREYQIPMTTQHAVNPDQSALVSWHTYTDPGHLVHTVDVTAVDTEQGVVTVAGFRDGRATVVSYKLTSFERTGAGWRLVLARDGLDDDRPAAITRVLERHGDRFQASKRVRFGEDEQSFERNRIALERADANVP